MLSVRVNGFHADVGHEQLSVMTTRFVDQGLPLSVAGIVAAVQQIVVFAA